MRNGKKTKRRIRLGRRDSVIGADELIERHRSGRCDESEVVVIAKKAVGGNGQNALGGSQTLRTCFGISIMIMRKRRQ